MAENGAEGFNQLSGEQSMAPFPKFHMLDTVQEVLDRNRSILEQIKEHHATQAPDDLAKTCVLIKELNGNIGQVMQLYQEISDSYVKYMGLSPAELSAPSAKQPDPPTSQPEQQGREQQPGEAPGAEQPPATEAPAAGSAEPAGAGESPAADGMR